MNNANTIVREMLTFVGAEAKSGWYAGITDDCARRLGEHGVTTTRRKYLPAISNSEARGAEDRLHALGFSGGPGGGDTSSRNVYIYKKTAGTNP